MNNSLVTVTNVVHFFSFEAGTIKCSCSQRHLNRKSDSVCPDISV